MKTAPPLLLPARRYLTILTFFVIIVCYAASCWFNVGAMSYDEHYQILEFAHYKKVGAHSSQLAWEYHEKIRSAVQPSFAFILIKLMDAAHLRSPYDQAFVFRLISAALYIFCGYQFFLAIKSAIKVEALISFLLLFSLLYYRLVYLGVRFSSENWSACFFILALALIMRPAQAEKRPYPEKCFLIGICFGLSFLFRFQSAILFAGFALWVLAFNRYELKCWIFSLVGFLSVGLLGALIDRWFYEEWVFSAWNYFRVNLLEGKAAQFGIEPWWWYFQQILGKGKIRYLEGFLMFLAVIYFVQNYKSPITWTILPFLFVHCWIGHKELRFLSVLAYAVPFIITNSIQFLRNLLPAYRQYFTYMLLIAFCLLNGPATIAAIFHVEDSSMEVYRYLQHFPSKPVKVYHNSSNMHYTLSSKDGVISPNFYKEGVNYKIETVSLSGNLLDHFISLKPNRDTLQLLVLSLREEHEDVQGRIKTAYDPDYPFLRNLNYRNWMKRGYCEWRLYKK